MTINFGAVPVGSVLPVHYASYQGDGASVAQSGLAVTDVEIYKDGSMTQRSSDAGVTLLDTDGTDLDSIVGANGFSIDTGDNTVAGFYAAGSFYNVWVASVTIDGKTVDFLAATFRLSPAEAVAGLAKSDIGAVNGNAALAATLASWLSSDISGIADSGSTTTMVDAARTESNSNYWAGMGIQALSGPNGGLSRSILTFDPANDRFTFAKAWPNAWAAGHDYTIIPWIDGLDELVEGTYTARQIMRLVAATLAGKVSGAGTTTNVFRDINDTTDRLTVTVDPAGDRTAVTINVT